ncbi:MAG: WYL domain-containing protein [Candidatus Stahlbacteria bacterium]|nr:WYL domain-containing protein [Candidatus Stahlbacteria bacterium]
MDTLINEPINQIIFTVLDVETTGLKTYLGHRMCEIGLLKFCGTKKSKSYSSLVNPERSIPEDVIEVHGITDEMVKNAPVFESIADEVLEFIKGTVLIAHNAEFDLGFIVKHLHRAKKPIPDNFVVDTLTIAKKHFHFPGNSLKTIAECLGIGTEGGHRALKDITTTKEVFQYFVKQLRVKTLGELLDLQGGSIAFPEIEEVTPPPVIAKAMKIGGRVVIKYTDTKGNKTERIVTPIEVDKHHNTEFLIAFCHLRNEQRVFRMDRIKGIKIVVQSNRAK